MKFLIATLGAAASLAATSALAQAPQEGSGQFYGSLGYTQLSLLQEADDFSDEAFDTSLGAITGRVGARFNPYVGVEGEFSFGVVDSEQQGELPIGGDAIPFTVSTSLTNALAGYVVGFFPITQKFEILARLGVGQAEADVEIRADDLDLVDAMSGGGDFYAVGVGAQYFFDGANGVRAEYTRFEVTDDGGDFDSVSISYVRSF